MNIGMALSIVTPISIYWASQIHKFVSFIKFYKFGAIVSSDFLLVHSLSSPLDLKVHIYKTFWNYLTGPRDTIILIFFSVFIFNNFYLFISKSLFCYLH